MLLLPTVKSAHASPIEFPVGAGGAFDIIVMVSRQVRLFTVTSTQNSVVSSMSTTISSVVSPVDHWKETSSFSFNE